MAATTHYAELKAFAQEHALVTNASVAFDVATLRPTYRLEIGLPGKSQAFAIAQRLGLPADILADARSRLAAEHVSMEETLAAIARAEDERNAGARAGARGAAAAAEADRERARAGVARARGEAAQMLADARRAADDLLARAEREVEEVRREVTRQRNLRGGARDRHAPPRRRSTTWPVGRPGRRSEVVSHRRKARPPTCRPGRRRSRGSACGAAAGRWAAPAASSR